MWSAYLKLKTYQRPPSLDLMLDDALTAWCVDGAVLWFGITVENALQERIDVGVGKDKRSEAKYTLEELLDAAFTLPRPAPKAKKPPQNVIGAIMAMAGDKSSGVKLWASIKPS